MLNLMAIDDDKGYLDLLVHEGKFKPHRLIPVNQVQSTENITWMLQKIAETQPDIILMDISFRHQSREFGIELTKRIKGKFPQQKIIMLTADDPASDSDLIGKIERSFEAGADAYLSKQDSENYCMEAFDEVFKGETVYASPALWKRILKSFQNKKTAVQQTQRLTPRQIEVLQHFANDKDYAGVADALNISQHCVAFHVRQIKIKTKKITLHGMVAEALRKGFIE